MKGWILKNKFFPGLLYTIFFMQVRRKQAAGKILYAVLFLVIVPVLQWCWARSLETIIHLPAIQSRVVGVIAGTSGALLMAWGMFALKKFGRGLPMNAYPPVFFVQQGPYRFLRHPIYWGYGLLMAGVFVFTGLACGLWIVTPVSILAMIALVMGYENIDLQERFKNQDRSVLLDIPSFTDKPIRKTERVATLFWLVTFLIVTNVVVFVLTMNEAPLWHEPFHISLFKRANGIQFLALPFILFVPFLLKNKQLLHQWSIAVIAGVALSAYLALLWPAAGAQYFYPVNLMAGNLELAVLLCFPVYLTCLATWAYCREYKKWRIPVLLITACIIYLQLMYASSPLLNLSVSVFIFIVSVSYKKIWLLIRNGAEHIANSWQEWIIGPVRIINHGIYVGLGAFAGILFCGLLVGKAYAWALLLFAVIVTVFAALWAQVIEGSDKLKRPFGYYGALVGILFASIILWLMGYRVWVLIGIISVIMPWVQAAGRFRCLVNGCCHGKPTDNVTIGIRFYHYRSRVCNISGLKGKFLHPTQVYSILWLGLTGFLLVALWQHNYSYSFVFGMYLILTGMGRFVEEAYRGEVQTPVWNGLRLYQWAAIVSALTGIFFTTVQVQTVELHPEYGWETWVAALSGGFFILFAMGVDFPKSNARFSRLV